MVDQRCKIRGPVKQGSRKRHFLMINMNLAWIKISNEFTPDLSHILHQSFIFKSGVTSLHWRIARQQEELKRGKQETKLTRCTLQAPSTHLHNTSLQLRCLKMFKASLENTTKHHDFLPIQRAQHLLFSPRSSTWTAVSSADNAMDAAPPSTPPGASPAGSGADAVRRLRDLNPDVAAASASRRRFRLLVTG